MKLFSLVSVVFIFLLVLLDSLFVPKRARKALKWMTGFYLFLLIFVVFQEPFDSLAKFLGVGRPVDIILYFSTVILFREFFLSRQRHYLMMQQLTLLTRENALNQVTHWQG
ncbi:MAG: DUF2304 domain-containing protein [Bdellovibrionaceae bacterium]|nr:DUF2304 domain-containing protein [Pseudobdellovibrionaceae bacterium]NUM58621.1 DUF2304 domain-containing protein [Pseudobdellovibrionaceae bacterium]